MTSSARLTGMLWIIGGFLYPSQAIAGRIQFAGF